MFEVNVIKPAQSLQLVQALRSLVWCAVLLAPLGLWLLTTNIYSYVQYGAPTGQIWYVFSKLFGLYAGLFLSYQVVSTCLKNTKYSVALPNWSLFRHQYIGASLFFVTSFHIAFFVTAVSLRKDTFAWALLLPDFKDFYHTSITIGLFAFMLAILAVLAALLRTHLPQVWRYLHRAMFLVVLMGLVHGYLIGTESRYGLYELFYLSLVLSACVALLLRWREARRRS